MPATIQLALRNLSRNRRRTLLTGLIIAMSTAVLILTDAFVQGFMDTTVRSATRLYSGDAQLHHRDYLAERDEEQYILDASPYLQQLANEPEVMGYSARVQAFGLLSSAADNRAAQIIGIAPESETSVSRLHDAVQSGQYLDPDGSRQQLMLGHRLADLLEVELGDRVVASVHNLDWGGTQQELFRVSGIFNFNARQLDENVAFVLQPRLQSMLGIDQGVHEIALILRSASDASDPALPLWERLSDEQVQAQGWTTLNPQLASMLELSGASLLVIGVVLFILAALGVTNGIFMSIYERTWEIGVLLAIGTRRRRIFSLIMAETGILAIAAVAAGLVLGAGFTAWLAQIGLDYGAMEISGVALSEVIRPEFRALQFTVVPAAVLVLTLVAAVYPALHAARIVPARALHKSL